MQEQSQKISNRRRAREIALQILFQTEFNVRMDARSSLLSFRDQIAHDSDVFQYALSLIEGVQNRQEEIDQLIQKFSINWKMERMSHVDRNILRVAIYEMTQKNHEVPKNVCINEAIEIAKKFGSQDSGHFVNGLLDQISKSI